MVAGLMETTRMPSAAWSNAIARVSATTPPFAAE